MNLETICINCMEDDSGAAVCPKCGAAAQIPPTNTLQLAPRTLLRQQYVIGRALGHGGFGITYLAYDTGLQSRLAIKEYMPSGVAGRTAPKPTVAPFTERLQEEYAWGLDRFLDEARTLKKFSQHPNIVSIDTIFRDNGTAYMVMEYLEGMTFEEFLRRRGGKVTFETALRIMQPVMDAMAAVHAEGILHRDISPDNIHLSKTGKVKLMDFGAARNALSQKSRNLSVILKEGYAPEEQYRSSGIQGPWTDVYATAATMYHAITGKIPPPALDRTAEDRLESPSRMGVLIPPVAEAALMKALAVRAADRFQSMEDFKGALTGEARPISQSPQTMTMQPPPQQQQMAPPQPPPYAQPPAQYAPPQTSSLPKTMPVASMAAEAMAAQTMAPAPPAPPSYAPTAPPAYAPPPMPPQQQYAQTTPSQMPPPQQPQWPQQQNFAAPPPPPFPGQPISGQPMPGQPAAVPAKAPSKSGLPKWLVPVAALALVLLVGGSAVAYKYGAVLMARARGEYATRTDPSQLPGQGNPSGATGGNGAPPQSDEDRQKALEQQAQQQGNQQAQGDQQGQQGQDQQAQGDQQQDQQPGAAPVARTAAVAALPGAPAVPPPVPVTPGAAAPVAPPPVAAAPVAAAPVAPAAPAAAAPVVAVGYDRMVAQAEDMINNSQYDEAAVLLKKAIASNPAKWQAYNTLAKDQLYFLNDPNSAFQNYGAALSRGGQASFYVYHDHGTGEFAATCSGWLSVSHDRVSFKADDGAHSFPGEPVKEAKKNKFFGKFLSASGKSAHAFHVRLMNNKLLNFAPSSGTPGPEADFIVKSIGEK